MLLITSCVTNKNTITVYPELSFPSFPKPKKATPLDKNLNPVTDVNTERSGTYEDGKRKPDRGGMVCDGVPLGAFSPDGQGSGALAE
jgi:hypothetical protein